jgi:hypothetical protein
MCLDDAGDEYNDRENIEDSWTNKEAKFMIRERRATGKHMHSCHMD